MKKLWSYLAVGFAFFSAGLIAMYKIMGERVSITVKKQRIWGRGNTMVLDIDPKVESPKMARLSKRDAKKQARVIRRNRKKADKAVDRLEF